MITGFLQSKEREKYLAGGADQKPNRTTLYPNSFAYPQTPTTTEEIERDRIRQIEAPLRPCARFRAYLNFFEVPEGGRISCVGNTEITMHCHNSQVQVRLEKSKLIPSYHKPRNATSEVDPILERQPESPFSQLPREIMYYIFQMLPQAEVFSVLPQLSQEFLALSTDRLYWKVTNQRDGLPSLPIDPRNTWIMASLHKQTKEPEIKRGQSAIVEAVPSGRPVGLDTYFSCPPLGRFLLRQGHKVIAYGMVMDTILDCQS